MSDSLNKTQFFDWKYIASWVLFYVSYIWPLENITDLYVRQYVWTWRLTINITEPEIHPRSSTRNTKTLVLTLTCELVPLLLTSQATGNDTESMALHWTSLDLLINKCMYMCLALMFTTCDLNVPFSSTNPFFFGFLFYTTANLYQFLFQYLLIIWDKRPICSLSISYLTVFGIHPRNHCFRV